MPFLVVVLTFSVCILFAEIFFYASRSIRDPELRAARKRLQYFIAADYEQPDLDILRRRILSEVKWLNEALVRVSPAHRIDALLRKANVQGTLGFFLLLSLVLGLSGYLVGSVLTDQVVSSIAMAAVLSALPALYVRGKKKRRTLKFERQLPDALDLIARSLLAGLGLTGGMKMAAENCEDPIGPELDATLDEINFGLSFSDAMVNLSKRVDCPDLMFVVTVMIIQRETGGNLADLLEKISRLIRERFKLKGRIRVLAAEGKMSALVLLALPFVILLLLLLVNPEYVSELFVDPIGRTLSGIALVMMGLGIVVMRRMINIVV